ncbi:MULTISPECIES: glycosyltransferase [Methylosinus]|uniref:Glycosyl transferase family 1 n=1 Tax=Methylosinus trichosporium (strain ATCC 35070 / NCIMB 11131 / UNIQEM 75 / OB3b) TaxID=595536 RepID=A0A2D2D295_METT3|nr:MULTISPECIES: glycosyltransferase [Methylosinus]ATQ69115.1 glycosyl transferase family 1 [Methylosinus trichosporium OB3b]OBS54485.1 glycosyl transferase family 1 [Methylosinus sp. 3S-1]
MSENEPGPLAGRDVALVHPAWHSCGTYRVVLGQIAAYRALGARVAPIAVSDLPGFAPDRAWRWRCFVAATPELSQGERWFAGPSFCAYLAPRFLREVLWPYLHGDQAIIRAGIAERARFSSKLTTRRFDLVHCNHFFLMPVAQRLAHAGAPILLDTHDLQARQFALMNERAFLLSPRVGYDEMLARELELMRGADLLLHLNAEEYEDFRALLPEKRHALHYPGAPDAPLGPGGADIVLVASNNSANVESVIWFLREVLGRAGAPSVKIVGNVDAGVKAREPALYQSARSCFVGRVEDPAAVYAAARLALLPTISGHGLSIKTVEAMASGLPMIATAHAFRGMRADAAGFANVVIADRAEDFAAALRAAASDSRIPSQEERAASATRRFYEENFSLSSYARRLAALVPPLLHERA